MAGRYLTLSMSVRAVSIQYRSTKTKAITNVNNKVGWTNKKSNQILENDAKGG